LLGHKKLATMALHTRVAVKAVGDVTSPPGLRVTEVRSPA